MVCKVRRVLRILAVVDIVVVMGAPIVVGAVTLAAAVALAVKMLPSQAALATHHLHRLHRETTAAIILALAATK